MFAAWVMQGRHGPRAVDLARRALARGAAVADERLRRATQEGILAVLHPSVMEQLRSAAMIDINQLPRNPALDRWKSELRDEGRVEGEARGRVEGEARGRAEGEARGRVEGEARLLVRILRLLCHEGRPAALLCMLT